MHFRIVDTFTHSLARLPGDEQKLAKTTAFDLQLNSAAPGMRFHRIDRSRDANFWLARSNCDLRNSIVLDDAMYWSNCVALEVEPRSKTDVLATNGRSSSCKICATPSK